MLSKSSTIYQIFIDRFLGASSAQADRPEFCGGNLRAISSELDYLNWLGIDTLWLSPFYKTSAYHGYHITDFFSVEPTFGNLDDLARLIDGAHARGMKVIADFVPNHCSYLHSFFMLAQAENKSCYRDWFKFSNWPTAYLSFLGYQDLPKINLKHQAARKHIISAARYWLSWGLDGYRLDHAVGPDLEFWRDFRDQIKAEYPDATLIGEVCLYGTPFRHLPTLGVRNKLLRWLNGFNDEAVYHDYVGILDGVLDYVAQGLFKDYATQAPSSDALAQMARKIEEHYSKFPANFLLPAFLDSQDTDRALYYCQQDKAALKRCLEVLFSVNQPVVLYYGTEIGMTQQQSCADKNGHGDLLARQPFSWDGADSELQSFVRGLILRRREAGAAG